MAIAHDNAGSFSGTTTPGSVAYTVAGSDRLLLAHVCWHQSAGQTISGITYNGVALTRKGAANLAVGGSDRRHELWFLKAPATGANTLEITFSADANFVCGIISKTGVDQTTPLDAEATASGEGFVPVVLVSSAAGDLVVAGLGVNGSGAITEGGGQTERWELTADFNQTEGSEEAGAASVTMSATLGFSNDWGIIGVSLNPAAGGGGGQAPRTMHQMRMRR